MNRMKTAISIQTAERTVDETPQYAEIIEEDMTLTLPQGKNTQIITEPEILVAENSNTTGLFEEHSSSSSNTENNASEDLNDGYEKPYSTLVSNNGHEIEHVYHKTKQNCTYENVSTFENVSFGLSVELQEFSLDKTTTLVYSNESVNMNDGENYSKDTDHYFQRLNVSKQTETKEYINLLLKQ
ncbi:uncharacterized protein LOC134699850 [Mytilus trossulus]|uniref:uncharacterized protein LOC134699850 n=1 Tax=Mytilus trossulus TaxID=6551 RepID=UPI003005B8D1